MVRPETDQPLVSVHDLMPETLRPILEILAQLRRHGHGPVSILVVPGCAWSQDQIATLRSLQQDGYSFAGHGWHHRVARLGGLGHWLHSRLISRQVAEHLALAEDEIARLIERCFAWFGDQGLQAPDLYVPPAWAMGGIPRTRLATLPFRYYETLSGIYDARRDRFRHLALLGYEADTGARALSLRLSNAVNRGIARWRSPRLAIHPQDLGLRLASDLVRDLRRYGASGAHAAQAELASPQR